MAKNKEQIMNKELQEILEKSSVAIDKLQESVEGLTHELSGDAKELWKDMKKNFSGVNEKLKNVVSIAGTYEAFAN